MTDFLHGGYADLLERNEVGQVRTPKYQLPSSEFRYGKKMAKDAEDAGDVIRTWTFHSPSRAPAKSRDFKALNKIGLQNGFYDSKGLHNFRKSHSVFENVKQGQKTIKITLPEEEFSYGNPNKPSTPFTSVLSNEYGTRSGLITQELYKSRLEESQLKSVYLPKLTNTTRVSQEKVHKKLDELNNVEQKPLFKLKKFQASSPKVDTYNKDYIENVLRSPKTTVRVFH